MHRYSLGRHRTHTHCNQKHEKGSLDLLAEHEDLSWVKQLHCDPKHAVHAPNKKSREVWSGHYVPVIPTPLETPYLVAYSRSMAASLGLNEKTCSSSEFAALFSGDLSVVKGGFNSSWATPYALSIYGEEIYQNCPFGTGNGYGDGRAISISEVVVEEETGAKRRWELQLKGAGTTPFCRSGDGRAVLRSSVREFLTSEAMFHLGVSTTRALSLVASRTEKVLRPWFSGGKRIFPSLDDPRLARYPKNILPMLLMQLSEAMKEPDVMEESICAITCRAAPSFLRVGHIELFSRRARSKRGDALAKEELELIVEHVFFREYPELSKDQDSRPLQDRALDMLRQASKRFAKMTAEWIRVGYCQGNFNSDNCLVGGRTMDFGPFGFIERFEPLWNMWTGGGVHYGFMNQPKAGEKNFGSLVDAIVPLLDQEHAKEARTILSNHGEVAMNATNKMWRTKLGLQCWSTAARDLLDELLRVMEECQADYTLFFRQLATVLENCDEQSEVDRLFHPVEGCFYRCSSQEDKAKVTSWLKTWITQAKGSGPPGEVAQRMRRFNPKFVPREWILVNAYTAANKGDSSLIEELQRLFETPYDEHDEELSGKYYKKAPAETYEGVGVGGTAFMT